MRGHGNLAILEALENLNTLIEANSLDELEVTDDLHLIDHKGEKERYWIHAGPDQRTQDAMRETYKSVLGYLQNFYGRMKDSHDQKRMINGVNTIMVLVGEATKKLQRFDALFKQSITEYKEFKDLQSFYRNKIIRETYKKFEKMTFPKIVEIPLQKEKLEKELHSLVETEDKIEEREEEHLLNDLETVKKDHLYELFYLKNEAGHFFYTIDLGKQLRLACDFGEFAEAYFGEDPLLQIKNWEDKSLYLRAQDILNKNRIEIEKFYQWAMKHKDLEMVAHTHDALMALMLAANSRNLIRQFSLKACYLYFQDFIYFLRQALHDKEFQKYLVYPIPKTKPYLQDTFDLIQSLAYSLFTTEQNRDEIEKSLIEMAQSGFQKGKLSECIARAYRNLQNLLQAHPSGPIFKALDLIRDQEENIVFDPLILGNYPDVEGRIKKSNGEIQIVRLPCPVTQELINKAEITEEFKCYLRSLQEGEKLLYFNFQQRTSWKEYARCHALEELSRQAIYSDAFTVITMIKDGEFYNQTGEYENLNDSKEFEEQLIQHLSDESAGFYFPPALKEILFFDWIKKMVGIVHQVFLDNKKKLSYLDKINWIDLAYLLIEFKILEIENPSYLTLTSKDGLDIASTSLFAFLTFLEQGQGKKWNQIELNAMQTLLFGPTLMQRERAIHPERMDRLTSQIKLLEERGAYLDALASLLSNETLKMKVKLIS